jgi:hypothetical protein
VGGLDEDRGDGTSSLFSRASASSVRSGQPFDNCSYPEDPEPHGSAVAEPSSTSVEPAQSKTKHKIVKLSMNDKEFDLICGVAIGQGNTVCIASNFRTNHQGKRVHQEKATDIKKGEMRVAKTLNTVFTDPRLDLTVLSDELEGEWLGDVGSHWMNGRTTS